MDSPAMQTTPDWHGTDIGTTGHSENVIAPTVHCLQRHKKLNAEKHTKLITLKIIASTYRIKKKSPVPPSAISLSYSAKKHINLWNSHAWSNSQLTRREQHFVSHANAGIHKAYKWSKKTENVNSHLHVDAAQEVRRVLEDRAVLELPPREFYHAYRCR